MNDISPINMLMYNKGLIVSINEIPTDCIAISSDCSASFPVSIMDASNTDSGRAIGISVRVEYHNNSIIIFNSSPFPIKSSTYFHRNCISKTITTIDKVKKNGLINDETINCFKTLNFSFIKCYEPRCFINEWT